MKYHKILAITVIVFLNVVLISAPLQANQHPGGGNQTQTPPPPAEYTITFPNPLKNTSGTLYGFIKDIINEIVLPVGGVIAVIFIIYAGFLFVVARGNEKKLEEAKRAFMYAAIGALILLGAWAIAIAIENTINQLRN